MFLEDESPALNNLKNEDIMGRNTESVRYGHARSG